LDAVWCLIVKRAAIFKKLHRHLFVDPIPLSAYSHVEAGNDIPDGFAGGKQQSGRAVLFPGRAAGRRWWTASLPFDCICMSRT
jgi:hypothetical protein